MSVLLENVYPLYVQGSTRSQSSDNKKVDELELRLKQEQSLKEETEQKYR